MTDHELLGLLAAGWIGCIAALGWLLRVRGARRREAKRRVELETSLRGADERAFNQQCAMAEKSLKLLELKESLEAEQAKSAALLRNILPERVVDELSRTGHSRPELFEHVTIFFSDIVNFTEQSTKLPPEELIAELSALFSEFDRIFAAHGCERIKTIGDAYLAVAGLPNPAEDHCARILAAAEDVRRFLEQRNRTAPHRWEMRFGIHSGPVVAGIVGIERYIYDIFGDAVNTAARMEQLSEPMKINVSEAARTLAPATYRFSARPPEPVKGKGVMQMYFLD